MSKPDVNPTGSEPSTKRDDNTADIAVQSASARQPYDAPRIESSDIFHTVSNGPVPQYCGGYGG